MSSNAARCVICGESPTVRSHLFPRALVHRIRGAEKNVVEGDRNRPGIRLTQAGLWDDSLLCEHHEACLGIGDDYAVRFCRRFDKFGVLTSTGNAYTAPNPKPALLMRFACGTIWRHAASKHGINHGLELGPYKRYLEEYLFNGGHADLEGFVGRSNLVGPNGQQIEVGIAPYKLKLLEWTIWMFTIGGFDFYVKTDKRPFPRSWHPVLLNDNDPITVPMIDALAFHRIPKFQPIFSQMLKCHG